MRNVVRNIVILSCLTLGLVACRLDDNEIRGSIGDGWEFDVLAPNKLVGSSITVFDFQVQIDASSLEEIGGELLASHIVLSFTNDVDCTSVTIVNGKTTTPQVNVTGCTGNGLLSIGIKDFSSLALSGPLSPTQKNQFEPLSSNQVIVDNTPPSVVFGLDFIANGFLSTGTSSPTLNSADSSDANGIDRFEVRITDSSYDVVENWRTLKVGERFDDLTPLVSTEEYSVEIRAVDVAGNVGDPVIWQGYFSPESVSKSLAPGINAITDFDAVDFDEDGDLDVIAFSNDSILIYKNKGTLDFEAQTLFRGHTNIYGHISNDLDGDGDLDFAVKVGTEVLFLINNDEKLSLGENTSGIDGNLSGVGDIDGDGDLDLVSRNSLFFKIYKNDGDFQFTLAHHVNTLNLINAADFEDLDGDGDLDVFVIDRNDALLWYQNDGSGGFSEVTIDSSVSFVFPLLQPDIDGDGDTDILVYNSADTDIDLYKNDGSGNFTKSTIIPGMTSVTGVRVVDWEADGDLDIVLAQDDLEQLILYENDGSENFSSSLLVTTPTNGAEGLLVADFDQDGDWDPISKARSKFYIYESDGGFTQANFGQNLTCFTAVREFRDYDNDGDEDIVCRDAWARNDGNNDYSIFDFSYSGLTENMDLTLRVHRDLDGDGDIDFLSYARDTNRFFWMRNEGGNVLSQQLIPGTFDDVTSIQLEDVDGNGSLDFVVSNDISTDTAEVRIYLNDGAMNYGAITIDSGADRDHQVAGVADLNGDGDLDILGVSEQFPSTLHWYENDGNENFTKHNITNTTGDFLNFVRTLDFDFDGDTDIILVAPYSCMVLWYENDGSANFTDHLINSTMCQHDVVNWADVDHDGDMDVAAGSVMDYTINLFENQGDGSFSNFVLADTYDGMLSFISLVNMDDDPKLEVVTESPGNSGVVWFDLP